METKDSTHVVIMAGGIGSRLWPLSTPEMPKQFIDVLGTGKSLIRMTVDRFLPVCDIKNFWVVTSIRYVSLVAEQLPEIPKEHILAEPQARNTAPCIAYACWKISSRYPDANVIVTPADALVLKTSAFAALMKQALDFSAGGERIVTAGIIPDRPETGYGYICAESDSVRKITKVHAFREKPDLPTAVSYLKAGNYYWNAGIFVWTAGTILSQIRRHAPQIAGIMDRLAPYFNTGDEAAYLAELFPLCEKISIDYAVMEKSDCIYVISDDLGWSDLGNWSAVREHLALDAEGNAAVGKDVRLFGCRRCIVHAQDCSTAVIEGLEDCIVSVKGGKMLVCRFSEEQRIKDFTAPSGIGTGRVKQD